MRSTISIDERTTGAAPPPLFATLIDQPPDPLLGLIDLHRSDPRVDKIDLGVGVYRDGDGRTPVMRAVKAAERDLLDRQASKAYLGPAGNIGFIELLEPIVFGVDETCRSRRFGLQTPGGTGALRLGAELIALSRPAATLWYGAPTWTNHLPIFARAGVATRAHDFFDRNTQSIAFGAMLTALAAAAPGDVVLLHGCCHNPLGVEFTEGEWTALIEVLEAKGLVPFIDIAYQGLGRGLDADAAGLRACIARLPEVMIAYSCDKNFGLYRERVGALWIQSVSRDWARRIGENVLALARANWSMPPDHGAEVVRSILASDALASDWRAELDAMRARIVGLRRALARCHPRLEPLGEQMGMFSTLPLRPGAVERLRREQGIYMADSGRISIAGLKDGEVDRLAAALIPFLEDRDY